MNDLVEKGVNKHIDPSKDQITLDDVRVGYVESLYIMLNKPSGVITAREDATHKTVLDLIEDYGNRKLFPVGRLDKDTEGMLLITNDGEFNHSLMSPKKHVSKTYYAEIQGCVEDKHIDTFNQGVVLEDGYQCMPAKLRIIESDECSKVEVVIEEGKYHQVKRMFQSIDCQVVYLKRIAIGNLPLDPMLPVGHYRELNKDEIDLLYQKPQS